MPRLKHRLAQAWDIIVLLVIYAKIAALIVPYAILDVFRKLVGKWRA